MHQCLHVLAPITRSGLGQMRLRPSQGFCEFSERLFTKQTPGNASTADKKVTECLGR
jgi:hypothetical protein